MACFNLKWTLSILSNNSWTFQISKFATNGKTSQSPTTSLRRPEAGPRRPSLRTPPSPAAPPPLRPEAQRNLPLRHGAGRAPNLAVASPGRRGYAGSAASASTRHLIRVAKRGLQARDSEETLAASATSESGSRKAGLDSARGQSEHRQRLSFRRRLRGSEGHRKSRTSRRRLVVHG